MADISISPSSTRPRPLSSYGAGAPDRRVEVAQRWLALLSGGYLAAVFLSRWDFPAIAVTAVSVVILGVRVAVRRRIDRIGWAAIVYLAALTAYGLLVRAAPPLGEIRAFFSFEGRVYVAFLPLLVLATVKVGPGDLRMVSVMLRACVAAGLGLVAVWMLGVGSFLGNGGNFAALTSSHHAAGFLFAVASLVLLVPGPHARHPLDISLGVCALGIVVASGSRTSMTGLLVAAIYLVASSKSPRHRARMLAASAACLILVAVLSTRVVSTVQYLGSPAFIEGAATQFAQADVPEEGKSIDAGSAPGAEFANILIRFGVWRASLNEFAKSPLLGIGPWRLNDTDRLEEGVPGLLVLAIDGQRVNGSGFGSHNLVLQTLAETGIAGLILLAAPWVLLVRRVRHTGTARPVLALIAFSIGTLLTSNAMISPALCFPLFIYVMMAARMDPMPGPPFLAAAV